MRGLSPLSSPVDIRPDHLAIVQGILRDYLPVGVKVWVFGSRANWTTKDSSDLDLALESESRLNHKLLAALKDAFEDSTLPYTVDIVDLNRIGDSFRQIVESQRVPLPVEADGTKQQVPLNTSLIGKAASGGATLTATSDQRCEVQFEQLLAEPVRNGIYKKKEFHGRGVKVVNMGELFANPRLRDVHMRRVELSESERHRLSVQSGDLLFARRSLVAEGAGKCSVVLEINEPTTFESSIIRARPDPTKADSLFLYYYFNSPIGLHALDTIRRQVAVAGITGTDLAQLPVEIPPLAEQQAIAHILGTLDNKIELNRRTNETLEAMARALFKSWFVDFEPVRAKMEGRLSALPDGEAGGQAGWRRGESLPGLPADLYDLFPDRLVDSELGEIPEGWEVKMLGEVAEVVGGTTPSTRVAEYWEGGKRCWATPKDLSNLSTPVLLDTERKITDAGLDKIGSGLLPADTLLLSSRAPIGYLAISEEPVAINQGFIAMPPRKGTSNLFMLYWCGVFHDEIVNHANGSTFLEISKSNFRRIPLVVPAEEVMTAFDRLASMLHKHVVSNERESHALAVQRDALLPGLVSGELAVGTE